MKEELQNHLIKNGFFVPTADIYNGLKGFYDYNVFGVRVKEKFIQFWKEFFVKKEGYYQIEGSLILPYEVLKASGHVDKFVDPIVECLKCKSIYRADHLIEEELNINTEGKTIKELNEIIKKYNLKCPKCGGDLSEVREENLMFKLNVGYGIDKRISYLRPETAQSIFINFLNVYWVINDNLPIAIYQIGKSFRNEISPRKFLIRLREFTQLEIEHFFIPNYNEERINNLYKEIKNEKINIKFVGEDIKKVSVRTLENMGIEKLMIYYLAKEFLFYKILGIPEEKLYIREIPKEELPHYSKYNFDLEVISSYGNIEIVGNAYRTNYDLKNHSEKSGKDLSIEINGKKVYPHVIEPSFGLERSLLMIFEFSYKNDRKYSYLNLHPLISPYLIGVIPLLKNKKELVDKAKEVYNILFKEYKDDVLFLNFGSIGKMYAKLDSIGVPYVVTIDQETLVNNTVTLRFRNTREQIRVEIDELSTKIRELINKYPKF